MQNNTNTTAKTLNLVIYALTTAMVFAVTYAIQLPMPWSQGGLVHIGDVILFTVAIVFGRKKGAVAGGIGMMLFDVLSAYTVWAPFTFIIRFLMGYIVGTLAFKNGAKGNNIKFNILGILLSLPILIGGYYIAEGLIYGNFITPVNSIPGNLGQFVIGALGAIPLSEVLNRIPEIKKLKNLE